MREEPVPDGPLSEALSREDLMKRRQAYDEAEREEVIANLGNFGDYAHPDDPPHRSLYLKRKYRDDGRVRDAQASSDTS